MDKRAIDQIEEYSKLQLQIIDARIRYLEDKEKTGPERDILKAYKALRQGFIPLLAAQQLIKVCETLFKMPQQ